MKLKTLLLRSCVLLLIAAAVAQYLVYQQAQEQAKRAAAQFLGYGQLRYERVWANLWGSASVWNLSFEPTGLTQAMIQTPLAYRIYARELRVHRVRQGIGGQGGVIEASLHGVRIPVIETRSSRRKGADGWALPTLAELGRTELVFDLDFTLHQPSAAGLTAIQVNGDGVDLARFYLDAEIEGSAALFRQAPDQLILRRLRLEYADRGLIAQARQVMAARAKTDVATLEQSLVEQLDRRALSGGWRWNPRSAAALRSFLRNPDYAALTLEPPGEVRLRNLNLYAARDWPILMGFGFSATGDFEHRLPGKPLP